MVAVTIASCGTACEPNPEKASTPTIKLIPATPAATPRPLRQSGRLVGASASEIRKTKTGVVPLRIEARPASTLVSAQAIRVKGKTLFRRAWIRKRRQACASRGRRSPRQRSTASRTRPAIKVRAAISVSGGMVSTPILIKV